MKAQVKKLTSTAKLPSLGSEKAAGYDLYADIESNIGFLPHQTQKIGTGLAITPPKGYFGAIFARSGLAVKGLRPANCVGVCDEDYTGEYIVALHNDTDSEFVIKPGDRIAQVVFMPYVHPEFEVVDGLKETERGSGGFGSTGK